MHGTGVMKTLEVFVKLFAVLNIKACKSIDMFKNFWNQGMGIEGQDKITCSLLAKLKQPTSFPIDVDMQQMPNVNENDNAPETLEKM